LHSAARSAATVVENHEKLKTEQDAALVHTLQPAPAMKAGAATGRRL